MDNMKSFFGDTGLTSTSANHYCNLAKEAARKLQSKLSSLRFYSTAISIIGSDKSETISTGTGNVESVYNDICSIGQLNALIAFFREAIKEKDRLLKEAKSWEDTEAREALAKLIDALRLKRPVQPDALTDDDIIKTWSVGEQEKYLSLEAMCAVIGKAIHEGGVVSDARIDLLNKISNPVEVSANGRDTIIYRYTQDANLDDVNDMYFSMQDRYREYQAELNGMKKSIVDALNKKNLENLEAYRLEMQKWNLQDHEYAVKLQEISEFEKSARLQKSEEVQKLKIVVPKRLQNIYEELQKLG